MKNDMAARRDAYRGREGPSWRMKLAYQITESQSSGLSRLGDEFVREAASFIRKSHEDGDIERTAERHPKIAAAKALWDNPTLKQQLVTLTLGKCERDYVAGRLGVAAEVIEYAEKLFFDIEDCRKATSWINAHVIMPESQSGAVDLATKYRAALWGGPHVARMVLDTEERVSTDDVQRIADQEMLLHMKVRQALEFPLDSEKDSLRMVKLYLDHDSQTKRLEFEKEKFRHRCEQDIRGHELAERRLESAARREEVRAAAKLRREEYRAELKRDQRKAAEFQAELRQDRHLGEEHAAIERASASPLAKLTWSRKPEPQPIPSIPERAAPIAAEVQENVAARDLVSAAA